MEFFTILFSLDLTRFDFGINIVFNPMDPISYSERRKIFPDDFTSLLN